ncbi:MAG: polysaccharide lyase [Verrucomicrobiota bacterium JB024]|nr:polysaccharide lyase [Verrucomicrobiota bacterium JB024]
MTDLAAYNEDTLEANLAPHAGQAAAAEGLIWSTGFEEGQFQFVVGGRELDTDGPLWAQGQFQDDDAVAFVSEPVRSGNLALKYLWCKDKLGEANLTKKSMTHYGKAATNADSDRWYGFSLYIPKGGFPDEKQNAVIFQLHATPDRTLGEPYRQPVVAFNIRDGKLTTAPSYDLEKVSPKNVNIEKNRLPFELASITDLEGKWTDFVVHAKMGLENDAVYQVWVDGKLMVDIKDFNMGYNDEVGPYPSWGVYSYNSVGDQRILYIDEVRIGDANATYEAVAPGRSDHTQKPRIEQAAECSCPEKQS